jgi:hypothetical protein
MTGQRHRDVSCEFHCSAVRIGSVRVDGEDVPSALRSGDGESMLAWGPTGVSTSRWISVEARSLERRQS